MLEFACRRVIAGAEMLKYVYVLAKAQTRHRSTADSPVKPLWSYLSLYTIPSKNTDLDKTFLSVCQWLLSRCKFFQVRGDFSIWLVGRHTHSTKLQQTRSKLLPPTPVAALTQRRLQITYEKAAVGSISSTKYLDFSPSTCPPKYLRTPLNKTDGSHNKLLTFSFVYLVIYLFLVYLHHFRVIVLFMKMCNMLLSNNLWIGQVN